jgi:two-component system sensor histidine kinase/response regulator
MSIAKVESSELSVESSETDRGQLSTLNAQLSTASVLVVDDNSINRYMLSQHVTQLGHRVAAVENGCQALERLRTEEFDLVLLDVMMPEMDGYTVLEQMKADPRLREVPVIVISGLDEIESVVRCVERGAEDYLTKPFNPTLLKARMGACLEKKRLWDELRKNYERLQALERLRDDLTHMIVHDLRTPLTSIIGGLQTIILGGIDPHSPEGEEMGAMALSGAHSLLGMINDLLDVSKIEAGQMVLDRSPLDLAAVARAAVDQVRPLAREKRIRLIEDVPPDLGTVAGDEEKVRRVLVNLLGNAIKFTPEEGEVALEARRQGNAVRVSVRDTGEGIPEEYRERIFEKFAQVESRQSGRKMSTGLGLTFCKLAVEAHGGTIRVESILSQGSTFWFTLPSSANRSGGTGRALPDSP